jgi:polyhydroxyalkanoate synthesis regulator phasin
VTVAQSRKPQDASVAEKLRTAIESTLSAAGRPARAGTTALTGERATQLLDEVAKRGRDARDELARRGQDAGAELARRGHDAAEEMAQRLEALERRLATLEDSLRQEKGRSGSRPRGGSKSQAEG